MESRDIRALNYLLAMMISITEQEEPEYYLQKAYSFASEGEESATEDTNKVVDHLYGLYPSKCVVRGTSTGKCSKDKQRLKTLLKKRDADDIENAINAYVKECKEQNIYMKNFATFLNNIPEGELFEPIPSVESRYQ